MAHYLWPPQWVGGPPKWVDPPGLEPKPADLADVIFEAELPCGIRFRAFRDGMLVFDLASWSPRPSPNAPGLSEDFEAEVEYQTAAVRLMNAHLACLQTATDWPLKPTVLTPGRVMRVTFADGSFQGGGGADRTAGLELFFARSRVLDPTDWRLRFGQRGISKEAMGRSIELLGELLGRPHQDTVLLRTELLYRSVAAYGDHDHSAALVHAWTATEGLMAARLGAYLDEEADRPTDRPGKFINGNRKGFLTHDLEARVTAEVLSLIDRIPFALYRGIRDSAKTRNDWLHSQKKVTSGDAENAIRTAEQLFELVEGVSLQMPLGRQLHWIG